MNVCMYEGMYVSLTSTVGMSPPKNAKASLVRIIIMSRMALSVDASAVLSTYACVWV
jgi:hypothetical protein